MVAKRGAEAFVALYEARRGRLPGDTAARDAAAARLRRTGLPTTRDEAWRYTNLKPLLDDGLSDGDSMLSAEGRGGPEDGLTVGRYAGAAEGLADEAHPMVAINTMLAEDGAAIEVGPGIDGGRIEIVARAGAVFAPRHVVRLGAGARLTLIETSRGGAWHCPVFEVRVGPGAALTHVRLQDDAADAAHLATIFAEVGEGGTYDAFALGLGARLARTEIHARARGPGGAVHLNAAMLLDGGRTGDVTTVVSHDAPGCASRQTVKTVLADASRGVFQGRIEVARAAQKTDGYQMSQALLLSDRAEMDVKPQLRIYADDVKCSHGATVGALDEDQVFYLRSRGVREAEARSLLVRAFLAEAFEAVADPVARAMLDEAVATWWERRQ